MSYSYLRGTLNFFLLRNWLGNIIILLSWVSPGIWLRKFSSVLLSSNVADLKCQTGLILVCCCFQHLSSAWHCCALQYESHTEPHMWIVCRICASACYTWTATLHKIECRHMFMGVQLNLIPVVKTGAKSLWACITVEMQVNSCCF